MRIFICLLFFFSLQATRNHFSTSYTEIITMRRCRSDSDLVRRRKSSLRRVDQPYNIPPEQHNTLHNTHQYDPEERRWLDCTPAQATVKAAYIGCCATITTGLGAALIGVLLSQ